MKNFKKLTVLFLALFVFAGMMSCDMNSGSSDELAVIGNWAYAGSTDPGLEISASECIFHMGAETYTGKIVSFDNTGWNGSDTGSGEYGYFVVQYKSNPSWNKDIDITNKFMVVRWKNLTTTSGATTMEFSEGSNADRTYFDTADAAIDGAIDDNNFFKGEYAFSTVTKLN